MSIMKLNKLPFLFLFALVAFSAAGCGNNESDNGSSGDNGGGNNTSQDLPPEVAAYYDGISDEKSGTSLLNDLRSLNKSKKKRDVGYKAALSSPAKGFYVTDGDAKKMTITTFYSGRTNKGTSGLNREHVWPNSHGGNLVENDIHMIRPTLDAENGSRGNSFYVEGMCDGSNGWDPAEEEFGDATYRGDAARIIFYCVVANSALSLIDENYHATTNANPDNKMGKLSDLLKWNLQYKVLDREQKRNNGAESLQGNRNPFVDHPEYACKIWGTYNANTKRVCGIK